MGESAGAAHVAAAVLLRRFGVDAAAGVRNDAYLGSDDAAALAACSIALQVDAAPLPMLISYAQRDLPQMQVQAGELFARLSLAHGFTPELLCVPEHKHFSQALAINTGDDSLARPVADFVHRHA